jgi:hypothetical protein
MAIKTEAIIVSPIVEIKAIGALNFYNLYKGDSLVKPESQPSGLYSEIYLMFA